MQVSAAAASPTTKDLISTNPGPYRSTAAAAANFLLKLQLKMSLKLHHNLSHTSPFCAAQQETLERVKEAT